MTGDPEFIAWRDGQNYHCDNCKSAFTAGKEAGRKAATEECTKVIKGFKYHGSGDCPLREEADGRCYVHQSVYDCIEIAIRALANSPQQEQEEK